VNFRKKPKKLFRANLPKKLSLADPWVIAHAMHQKATVVTKEEKITAKNNIRKVTIHNVCENMNVPCINDFKLIKELKIQFKCARC
jgi:hypothetical protein